MYTLTRIKYKVSQSTCAYNMSGDDSYQPGGYIITKFPLFFFFFIKIEFEYKILLNIPIT